MRKVEYYVLWKDRTWTVESVKAEHKDTLRAIEFGRQILRSRYRRECQENPNFEEIGPLYHIGDWEEDNGEG